MRFNEKRFAEEYDRRLIDEGYPGNLLPLVLGHLEGVRNIIDIGSGSGFFAIPLAERGYRVHAVEPSAEMSALMKKKIESPIVNNIKIYNTRWEEWEGDHHEASICIHSLYPMKDPVKGLENMLTFSERRVLAVKKPDTETLTGKIKGLFKKGAVTTDYIALTEEFLQWKDIRFEKEDLFQERITRFASLDEGVSYYRYFLKLDTVPVELLTESLEKLTEEKDGFHIFKSIYHDILYTF
jgi:SAM-dependent methyltransferase